LAPPTFRSDLSVPPSRPKIASTIQLTLYACDYNIASIR
jgi:hypothetical protein